MSEMPRKDVTQLPHVFQKRRKRTFFSKDQQTGLEDAYQRDHWPAKVKYEKLSDDLDMTLMSVKTWFQNRRAKSKREEEEEGTEEAQKPQKKQQQIRGTGAKFKCGKPQTRLNGKKKTGKSSNQMLRSQSSTSVKDSHACESKSKSTVPRRSRRYSIHEKVKHEASDTERSEDTTEWEEEDEDLDEKDEAEELKVDTALVEESSREQSTDSESQDDGNLNSNNNNNNNNNTVSPSPPDLLKSSISEADLVLAQHNPRIPADLFASLIDMMALAEGDIIKPSDPSFSQATNHALYGIQLKGGDTVFYDKEQGFSMKHSEDE